MKDRIVNGYQAKFGKVKRRYSWPENMKLDNIKEIKVKWYVTHSDTYLDFPTDIESALRNYYKSIYGYLPIWHKQ